MLDTVREQAETLDELLCVWYEWQQHSRVGRGFAPKALVVGDFRPGRQYDAESGVLDDELDVRRARAVDFAVTEQMEDPFRAAIYNEARNVATGLAVWTSPRLPANRADRELVVVTARELLANLLRMAGVM